jgi:hypothetical protein
MSALQRKRSSLYIQAQRRTEFERHIISQLDAMTSHLRYRQYLADYPDRIPPKSNSVVPYALIARFPVFNNEDIDAYEGANLCRSFINSLRIDLE